MENVIFYLRRGFTDGNAEYLEFCKDDLCLLSYLSMQFGMQHSTLMKYSKKKRLR